MKYFAADPRIGEVIVESLYVGVDGDVALLLVLDLVVLFLEFFSRKWVKERIVRLPFFMSFFPAQNVQGR